ncbi:hypothetical protein Trydic_g10946 [Trypoxylus dichotomus]
MKCLQRPMHKLATRGVSKYKQAVVVPLLHAVQPVRSMGDMQGRCISLNGKRRGVRGDAHLADYSRRSILFQLSGSLPSLSRWVKMWSLWHDFEAKKQVPGDWVEDRCSCTPEGLLSDSIL